MRTFIPDVFIMKRFYSTILWFIILAVFLTGCSGKKTLITFFTWTPHDEYSVNQELIKKFNKTYPKVKIKHINDSSSRAMDKLQTMFAAGTPPDVMSIHGAYYVPLASKNALFNLDSLIKTDKEFNLSDFYPILVNACRYNDVLYSLPRYTSVYVLFYNKELFKQEGLAFPDKTWDWDDYLQAAIKLTKDADNNGIIDQYGCVIDFWGARLYPWIWQNNGKLFNADRTKCLVDHTPAVEAVQFLVNLQYEYKVTPRTLPQEYKSNVEMFSMGKIGMFISGAWEIQNLRSSHLDWDIAPLPKRKQHATILGMENYAISRTTERLEEAWLFFKFLLNAESQKVMADKLEKQPSLISIAKEYVKSDTGYNRQVLVDALQYAKQCPNIPQWSEVGHFWQDELDLIWVGKKSVSEGLSDAARKINEALNK